MATHRAADHLPAVESDLARGSNPADIEAWTEGRAIVSTGARSHRSSAPAPSLTGPDQQRLIFPGIGLGAVAVRARRITDAMFMAAAKALAALSPALTQPEACLLPPVWELRSVAL